MRRTALVSSCLLGLATRYDGTDNLDQAVVNYLKQENIIPIPICPEQLSGLPTPRPKCWFVQGDGHTVLAGTGQICDENGIDVTAAFLNAAEATYKTALLTKSTLAILKQRSPSCGSCQIHQNGKLIEGMGVTAARLNQAGIKVLNEEEIGKK